MTNINDPQKIYEPIDNAPKAFDSKAKAVGVPPKPSLLIPIITGLIMALVGYVACSLQKQDISKTLKAYQDSLNAQNNAYIYDVRTNKVIGQNNWSSLKVANINGNDTLGIFIVDKTISNASIFFDSKTDGMYIKQVKADSSKH